MRWFEQIGSDEFGAATSSRSDERATLILLLLLIVFMPQCSWTFRAWCCASLLAGVVGGYAAELSTSFAKVVLTSEYCWCSWFALLIDFNFVATTVCLGFI